MSHKISYRECGTGEVIILVHGYGGSVMHWDPIVAILKNRYRVVVPNFSHLYMSQDRLLFTVQIEKFAQFIREKFPKQKVRLVGTSYGGALCWGLTLHHPELVMELALINPMVSHPTSSFLPTELKYFFRLPLSAKPIFYLLSTPVGKSFLLKIAELFRTERTEGAGKIDRLEGRKLQFISHVITHFSWILRNENWNYWSGRFEELTARTCLIYDSLDPLFAEKTYLHFAAQIECESVIVTKNCGHLSIKQDPEFIAYSLVKFFSLADEQVTDEKSARILSRTGTDDR